MNTAKCTRAFRRSCTKWPFSQSLSNFYCNGIRSAVGSVTVYINICVTFRTALFVLLPYLAKVAKVIQRIAGEDDTGGGISALHWMTLTSADDTCCIQHHRAQCTPARSPEYFSWRHHTNETVGCEMQQCHLFTSRQM